MSLHPYLYFTNTAWMVNVEEAMGTTGALLFGRRTWQTMAAAWPDRDDGTDPLSTVAALKQQEGGDLAVMGSSQLSRTLVASGLVDEYRLLIEPVLLGGGKSVFPTDRECRPLDLISATPTPTGVLLCVYRPGETPPMPEWASEG